jgi:hypothetical protein
MSRCFAFFLVFLTFLPLACSRSVSSSSSGASPSTAPSVVAVPPVPHDDLFHKLDLGDWPSTSAWISRCSATTEPFDGRVNELGYVQRARDLNSRFAGRTPVQVSWRFPVRNVWADPPAISLQDVGGDSAPISPATPNIFSPPWSARLHLSRSSDPVTSTNLVPLLSSEFKAAARLTQRHDVRVTGVLHSIEFSRSHDEDYFSFDVRKVTWEAVLSDR